ncbi:MAG: adenylate/guanylate cyclase domain-containing protein [Alphaproteobacteria bacterium]|nr:adenylate/guanylate cyclase domain-containing protein [Alphaproteobacteria bacterium]
MTPQQFQRLLFIFACTLAVLLGFAGLTNMGELRSRTQDASLDLYTRISPFEGDPDFAKMMVLVDIDEQSLQSIGQWPWPRSVTAELIDRVNAAQPLAIGLDILMTEEDRFTPENIAELSGQDPDVFRDIIPDGDAILGDSLANAPTIMATNLVGFASNRELFAPVGVAQIGTQNENLLTAPGALSPVPALQTSPGSGFVSISLQRDNAIRRAPLIANIDGKLSPSFALEMLRVAQGARNHIAKLAGDTGNATTQVKTGRIIATGDEQGFITLHHGYSERFTTVSAATIMNNDDGGGWAEQINNSFVILGSTASGLKDIHATSLEASLPGPYIHLQILHQILSERHINAGFIFEVLELLAGVVIAIVMSVVIMRVPLTIALLTLTVITVGTGFGFVWSFNTHGYLGNIFMSLGNVLLVGILVLAIRAAYEEFRRRKLRNAFNQYLSPEMVRRIDASGSGPSLGGTTTNISVMFMDVRGFTTLSEALADDPETLTTMINKIMDHATSIILDHGGTLDKYIGDALMAFWNAPMPQDDHARRAIDAAIALEDALPAINQELKDLMGDRWPGQDIRIGIGIATGDAVVGNMGSRFRFSYSCIGDIVNLAARLEPFGKNTGLPTTLADATAEQGDHPDLITIDEIAVRGKSNATVIYSPLRLSPETRDLHDALIKARQSGTRRAITSALSKLAKVEDYPASLMAYYQK